MHMMLKCVADDFTTLYNMNLIKKKSWFGDNFFLFDSSHSLDLLIRKTDYTSFDRIGKE